MFINIFCLFLPTRIILIILYIMTENKKTAIIYGVEKDNKYHYIGKTIKFKKDEIIKLTKHSISYIYNNPNINKIIVNSDAKLKPIKEIPINKWYDEKLNEVILKYNEDHPLQNAQWMKDGKRSYWDGTNGYWYGKKRDDNTLYQLSKSKFRKILQYDINGIKVKEWKSVKHAAIEIFKDYKIVNGSASSKLYGILRNKLIDNKFSHNSYWFRYGDLIQHFNIIPKKINISKIKEYQKDIKSKQLKENHKERTYHSIYSVEHYIDNKLHNIYDNIYYAGYDLKLHPKTVQRVCNGNIKNSAIDLRYGKKIQQLIGIKNDIPEYETIPLPIKKNNIKSICFKTKTSYSIEKYDLNHNIIAFYPSVKIASKKLKMTQQKIRSLCKNNKIYKKYYLKYSVKMKTFF